MKNLAFKKKELYKENAVFAWQSTRRVLGRIANLPGKTSFCHAHIPSHHPAMLAVTTIEQAENRKGNHLLWGVKRTRAATIARITIDLRLQSFCWQGGR